ncbi:MAG: hypothetical protein Q605_AUC00794G0001, partial [Actinomyces urogenitalis DORA_12]
MAPVRRERDLDRPRTGDGDTDGVGLERAPRQDDVVPLVTHGVQQVLDERHRA